MMDSKIDKPMRMGEYDPLALDEESVGYSKSSGGMEPLVEPASLETGAREAQRPKQPKIEFFTPSQIKAFEPPIHQNMAGDFHIQRGAPSVLAGPPGCGKSRATLWLAVLGARGCGDWFGMKIHGSFRTLIIQSENSLSRLHRDMAEIDGVEEFDEWIRISAFPAYQGFQFADRKFREELKEQIRLFQPHLIIIDPWNNVTRDAMEKDYLEAFEYLREVMGDAPNAACLILHHLRKPRSDDRHRGRSLSHLLSGSYVLVSVARTVLVMQPASDDTEDARVVVTPAKNNDGELGPRTAWERHAGWFEPVSGFDWEAFDEGVPSKREHKVKEEHLVQLFENGKRWHRAKEAAEGLQEIADIGRSAAYEALKLQDGRFSALLTKDPSTGLIGLAKASEVPVG